MLAIASVPVVVMGPPVKPVPLATDVTLPLPVPLLLNVVQSVDVRYPLTVALAAAIEIAGVVPPDETTGAVPVTDVTGAVPLDAAVRRPCWSTVMLA